MILDPQLLSSSTGQLNATIEAHGLYNTFQFVLRLSPQVHGLIAQGPSGIITSDECGFERAQAFSTYLHETIHWWQHIGSTYGLLMSLTYPCQTLGNLKLLKELLTAGGFKKPIRKLSELPFTSPRHGPPALYNTIVNNHFDMDAFRRLTFSPTAKEAVVHDRFFECVGHTFQIAYSHCVAILASLFDSRFDTLPNPKTWERTFDLLRTNREEGFYYRSPVQVWPLGAHEIFEGQACLGQLQFLAFASGGRLGWKHLQDLGMLHGIYRKAFDLFLHWAELDWPATIDHPTVGLFLLVCDMAINPGAGFPYDLEPPFSEFVTDTDPGARFVILSRLVRLQCPELAQTIRDYSRAEYEHVTEELARAAKIPSPLSIAKTFNQWASQVPSFRSLMDEHHHFSYAATNLPIRVLFSHFLAVTRDKAATPEFFVWPGAWMAGERLSQTAQTLFERHAALFVDKQDDDGVFPRILPDRDASHVHATFESFYEANVVYDLADQWIARPGPFECNYRWLSQSAPKEELERFAVEAFQSAFGVDLKAVELLA